jgi:hypothetical protein
MIPGITTNTEWILSIVIQNSRISLNIVRIFVPENDAGPDATTVTGDIYRWNTDSRTMQVSSHIANIFPDGSSNPRGGDLSYQETGEFDSKFGYTLFTLNSSNPHLRTGHTENRSDPKGRVGKPSETSLSLILATCGFHHGILQSYYRMKVKMHWRVHQSQRNIRGKKQGEIYSFAITAVTERHRQID